MSIAQSVVEAAEAMAKESGAARITSVTLDIGDLSGAAADAVKFCFEAASAGTMAEGSELVINRIKPRARCPECEVEFEPESRFVICPFCLGFAAITAGEELSIKEIEVE